MRWRDIRFEKPTVADGDEQNEILMLHSSGFRGFYPWTNTINCIAWMPTSELPAFNPIPDPPDGWRFVQAGEAFDKRAKFWSNGKWRHTLQMDVPYSDGCVYIVPIKPPEPQYRPFANAAEFEPYRDKWVLEGSRKCRPTVYCDTFVEVNGTTYEWDEALLVLKLTDGTPFGVRVDQ